jgi:hypothetical protein
VNSTGSGDKESLLPFVIPPMLILISSLASAPYAYVFSQQILPSLTCIPHEDNQVYLGQRDS